jgi:molecular chaperone GrpE
MPDKMNESREIPISFDSPEIADAIVEDIGDPRPVDPVVEPMAEPATQSDDSSAGEDRNEETQTAPPKPSRVSQLQSQVDVLMNERASLYDKLLRRQAEFANYRKRVERERSELYQHGREDVLLQFLPVVDNFERALSSLEESEGDAEALLRGLELIHKQFKDALSKLGLEPVESVGHAFDPHVHEAVTLEATDKHKENTVIEEFQRGYKIGDRLLRPAKVKVASSPEK